jgi:hypothetical protein
MKVLAEPPGYAEARYPVSGLDRAQIGHLRHFANLSRQAPNQWDLMKGKGYGQEDFGGYRFQLAYMAYALGLTYRHRLPAAPGVFKPIFERLIEKMLMPEVWMYWRDVSRGGSIFNAHLSSTYAEEWDPVVRDNIMYSAYLQSMTLMYHYLFDDARFAQPGALTLQFWSYFWGGQEKRFVYDEKSLNDHLYWQMVESGYLGVACEPNCVFQICNQPAILGFRLHDLVYGGSIASDVVRGYEQAWRDFGRIGENGHYNIMMAQDTKAVRANLGKSPWVDAWCGALMNMWNRDFVRAHYAEQVGDFLRIGREGELSVITGERPLVMGQTIVSDSCDFGWVAAWASEMGDAETLNGLLKHADGHMSPRWRDGGLYYPRNDRLADAEGNVTMIEPMSGNVLLGYARLNVPDGLCRFYNEPWDPSRLREPALIRVASDVDVSKAWLNKSVNQLEFVLQRHDETVVDGAVVLGNLTSRGAWILHCDQHAIASGNGDDLEDAGDVDLRRCEDGLVLRCIDPSPRSYVMTFKG